MKKCVCLFSFFMLSIQITPQILISYSEVYIQDFNTLASGGSSNVMPAGWFLLESGTNADISYTASFGVNSGGDTYSYGLTLERALGTIRSLSLVSTIGARFRNNSGNTLNVLPISYYGEQWRLSTAGREDRLDFQYSLDATSLNSGTWVDVNELDFIAPITTGTIGYRDGNLDENRRTINFSILNLNIPIGADFWIRWIDVDATGNDDGLAIDDFKIDLTALPVELTSFSATAIGKDVKLSWNTSTEVNNYGFEVERSVISNAVRNLSWEKIGFVYGNGNSNSPKDYSFVDDKVVSGKYSYRLKQIDNDGQFEYSKTIEVDVKGVKKFELTQNYPNPFNPITKISWHFPVSSWQTLKVYDVLGNEVATLVNEYREAGSYSINFDASNLPSGVYIYKLQAGEFTATRKMMLVK